MRLLKESGIISLKLLKIMLPISILVKICSNFGLIELIAKGISPIMELIGLSGEMGIVWATAMVTNIYGGILILFTVAEKVSFTVAEVTIVSTLILFAHALPIEVKIISETGAKASKILAIRIICGIIAGAIMNLVFKIFNLYQEEAVFKLALKKPEPGIFNWIIGECQKYLMIFIIIFLLLVVMEFLKRVGILEWMNKSLSPLMTFMGIDSKLSFVCIVGLTMGIGYGGGLIIKEIKNGDYSKRDLFLVAVFMSLCHSMIEDTLLMLSIGGKPIGVFGARIAFAILFTVILNKTLPKEEVINFKESV